MKKYWLAGFGMFMFATVSSVPISTDEQLTNLLSLEEGTLPVVVPKSYGGWNAEKILDNGPKSGWACAKGNVRDNVFVLEMTEPACGTCTLDFGARPILPSKRNPLDKESPCAI